jgi:hypothetical protein
LYLINYLKSVMETVHIFWEISIPAYQNMVWAFELKSTSIFKPSWKPKIRMMNEQFKYWYQADLRIFCFLFKFKF